MKDRVIFHCDANSFFASCELASKPELKGKPVAVAGNPEKRTGIILTKNEIAKKYGVKTGETIWQAKQKCPKLICLPPHYKLYEEFSAKLRKIYERYTDRVESFGIDECWLDMTDSLKFFGDKKELADRIRNEIEKELNITVSVGVSFGKLFAKLGSDLKKPNATTIISRKNYKDIVYPLPITAIIGIGKRLEKRYNKIGVTLLGEIIKIPDDVIKKKFGILGIELKQKLLGNDTDEVKKCDAFDIPKSIGNGTTTRKDVYSKNEIKGVVTLLADEVSSRLRQNCLSTSGLSVTLKTATFEYFHQTIKIPYPTDSSTDIARYAMETIDNFWEYNLPVRAIRICSYNLSSSKQTQLNMFEYNPKSTEQNVALDQIRKKYGYVAINTANSITDSSLLSTFLKNII